MLIAADELEKRPRASQVSKAEAPRGHEGRKGGLGLMYAVKKPVRYSEIDGAMLLECNPYIIDR